MIATFDNSAHWEGSFFRMSIDLGHLCKNTGKKNGIKKNNAKKILKLIKKYGSDELIYKTGYYLQENSKYLFSAWVKIPA